MQFGRARVFQFRPYSAIILSSPSAIRQLEPCMAQLMPSRDITAEPRFFLAAVSSAWRPRTVVVRRGDQIVGVVYAKERRWAGAPAGLLCLDGRLGNMGVADPPDVQGVLRGALQAVVPL